MVFFNHSLRLIFYMVTLHILQVGDVLNVLAPIDTHPDGSCHSTCDFTQGLLVLHPDVLLSGER